MAKKKISATIPRPRRATWKGELSFGLVNFTVEAFNAVNRQGSDIHFHQLHTTCHSRIHYDKVCPIHGKVTNDEIVSGYEYEKGKYVEIEPEQLDALRTHDERTLKIDSFIAPDEIDPVYYDGRMYYLVPVNKAAEEAYSVMVAAMQREERYAVGQVVFSGKEQLALVRPIEDLLHMAMLNYSSEINPPDKVAHLKKPTKLDRQLKLAQALVRDWSDDDFDFAKYTDTYRDQVQKLIASKVKGHKVVLPKETEPEPVTISLMDALKKSIAGTKGSTKAKTTKPRKVHSA